MDDNLIKRLESAVSRLEALSAGGGADVSGTGDAATDPSILAFDDLISQYGDQVMNAAENIGGQVLDVSKIIQEAFNVQKELLVQTKQTQKPDSAGLAEFLKPLNEVTAKASALTEGRRSDFFNHLKTGSDSLNALAWIAYTGKNCGMSMPIAHVEESWNMAEFYSNKPILDMMNYYDIKWGNYSLPVSYEVLVEYRNKDANHVEWVKAMKELYVPGLRDYVKSHYPLGPVWSATGKRVASATMKAPTPGAPAPPQAPPPTLFISKTANPTSSNSKAGMSAVFQEISSGKAITSGLRKVTDDMKSKNRADRSGVVPVVEKKTRAVPASQPKTGPPKLELQMGRKWVVENQIGQNNLAIDDCDSKQTVYIFGCKNSVLQIQGKVNNITLDKCTKMGVVFQDLVAACEIVNCNSVQIQSQGMAPTISVDNTSGCELYLSKESLETSITTAKSTEVNVLVPASEQEGDWTEHPLPQQYIHTYKDGQFETIPMSHSGA